MSGDYWADIQRERDWRATEIGAAFSRFENALGRAWTADCQENISDKRLRETWDVANRARAEFLHLMRGW